MTEESSLSEKMTKRIKNRLREIEMLKSSCERVKQYKLKNYYEGCIDSLEFVLKLAGEK